MEKVETHLNIGCSAVVTLNSKTDLFVTLTLFMGCWSEAIITKAKEIHLYKFQTP